MTRRHGGIKSITVRKEKVDWWSKTLVILEKSSYKFRSRGSDKMVSVGRSVTQILLVFLIFQSFYNPIQSNPTRNDLLLLFCFLLSPLS